MEPGYSSLTKQHSSLKDGVLSVLEFRDLPFEPKRIYWISEVGKAESRGHHAHRKLSQFMYSIQGSCNIELTNGVSKLEFLLEKNGPGLIVSPGWWRVLHNFSSDAIIQVLGNLPYDESDYIRDYSEFLKLAKSEHESVL
jgi:hypothetical protein